MPWITDRGGQVADHLRRRCGPRPYVAPTLEVFRSRRDGPPIRLRDLAAVSGFSSAKLLMEVRAGHLRRLQSGRVILVDFREAQRYLQQIGLIPSISN